MILVSGTKRSGTSMWMRALHTAGVPVIGETWPRSWGKSALRQANPDGFYESSLREGVHFLTNPDPQTGTWLSPQASQGHAVKVFLAGVARTDLAYIERVLVSMRPWRAYVASMVRLRELEQQSMKLPSTPVEPRALALEWWLENYLGLRDILLRGYPCHVVSYPAVLQDPDRVMDQVFGWLGVSADPAAAAGTIRTRGAAATPQAPDVDLSGLPAPTVPVFDELFERIHQGRPLDEAFLDRMNALHEQLLPWIHNLLHEAEVARQAALEEASARAAGEAGS